MSSFISKTLFNKLNSIYYDTKDPGSFGGINSLLTSAKNKGIDVNIDQIVNFLKTQDTYTLHKPVRKRFLRNQTIVSGIDDQWQADLADVSDISRENQGNHYLLTVVDCFSKYAWAIPSKRKDATSILAAIKELFRQAHPRKPKRLQTDKGKEFLNSQVQNYLKEIKVQHFFSFSDFKAAMVERFNRTLKSKMWRYFTTIGNHRYIDALADLVTSYNNSIHRTIGMAPSKVSEEHVSKIWHKVYGNYANSGYTIAKVKNNETIRIPTLKTPWDKGYIPNWTEEVFKINKPVHHLKKVYKVEDETNEKISGVYYPEEIQQINNSKDHFYKVEKILKHKLNKKGKKELFVKWKGWPDKFNSWITEDQLQK